MANMNSSHRSTNATLSEYLSMCLLFATIKFRNPISASQLFAFVSKEWKVWWAVFLICYLLSRSKMSKRTSDLQIYSSGFNWDPIGCQEPQTAAITAVHEIGIRYEERFLFNISEKIKGSCTKQAVGQWHLYRTCGRLVCWYFKFDKQTHNSWLSPRYTQNYPSESFILAD